MINDLSMSVRARPVAPEDGTGVAKHRNKMISCLG